MPNPNQALFNAIFGVICTPEGRAMRDQEWMLEKHRREAVYATELADQANADAFTGALGKWEPMLKEQLGEGYPVAVVVLMHEGKLLEAVRDGEGVCYYTPSIWSLDRLVPAQKWLGE